MVAIGVFMSLRLSTLLHKYMEKQVARQGAKLAEMVDCSLSYIGFVERGEMSLSLYNFIKISSVLKLDV